MAIGNLAGHRAPPFGKDGKPKDDKADDEKAGRTPPKVPGMGSRDVRRQGPGVPDVATPKAQKELRDEPLPRTPRGSEQTERVARVVGQPEPKNVGHGKLSKEDLRLQQQERRRREEEQHARKQSVDDEERRLEEEERRRREEEHLRHKEDDAWRLLDEQEQDEEERHVRRKQTLEDERRRLEDEEEERRRLEASKNANAAYSDQRQVGRDSRAAGRQSDRSEAAGFESFNRSNAQRAAQPAKTSYAAELGAALAQHATDIS
jgi:hypothetical protein